MFFFFLLGYRLTFFATLHAHCRKVQKFFSFEVVSALSLSACFECFTGLIGEKCKVLGFEFNLLYQLIRSFLLRRLKEFNILKKSMSTTLFYI